MGLNTKSSGGIRLGILQYWCTGGGFFVCFTQLGNFFFKLISTYFPPLFPRFHKSETLQKIDSAQFQCANKPCHTLGTFEPLMC